MNLLSPEPGLVIWSTVGFISLIFILKAYAWKPILHALKLREETIEMSLLAAKKAREEIKVFEIERAKLLNEAKAEREKLLKDAWELKNNIIAEAKDKAIVEANKLLSDARKQIEKEKMDALKNLKVQMATISVSIASKILEKELESSSIQDDLINKYLDNATIN